MTTKVYDIKSGAVYLGCDEMYLRKLIRDGKIKTNLVQIAGTKIWKHEIAEEELKGWKERARTHTSRTDGRNKYTVYANAQEIAAMQEWLKSKGMPAAEMTNAGVYAARKAKREAAK